MRGCAQVMRALTSCWLRRTLRGAWDLGFGEDALQAIIDLRGEKADGGFGENVVGGVEDLDGEAGADLRGALSGDVDVGFQVGVLVDGGEDGCGGDVIAEMDGDVADYAVERSTDVVVVELPLLGVGKGGVGFEIAFCILIGLRGLIVCITRDNAGLQRAAFGG